MSENQIELDRVKLKQAIERAKAKFEEVDRPRREQCEALGISADFWDQVEELEARGVNVDGMSSMDAIDYERKLWHRQEEVYRQFMQSQVSR